MRCLRTKKTVAGLDLWLVQQHVVFGVQLFCSADPACPLRDWQSEAPEKGDVGALQCVEHRVSQSVG